MTRHFYSWLALGDSYTIGEALPLHESFPYQALQLLRNKGLHFHAPEIVAKTGWTTAELAGHLLHTKLNDQYDLVTLLIGVNNQYRGLSLEDYKSDLEFLLKKALHFAVNKAERVVVVSIPDWGTTPFAEGRDRDKIAKEIDQFNAAKKALCEKYSVAFIDITADQRTDKDDKTFVASDKLHPSGKEYAKWAEKVSGKFIEALSA
jgi:lysophospholipase L1-like esterase